MVEMRIHDETLFVGDEDMVEALGRENAAVASMRAKLGAAREEQRLMHFAAAEKICKEVLADLTQARAGEPSAKVRKVLEGRMRSEVMPMLRRWRDHQKVASVQKVFKSEAVKWVIAVIYDLLELNCRVSICVVLRALGLACNI